MLSNEELQRYSRHILLPEVNKSGQEKLKSAKVLVIGAGGLGCPVLLYLVSAGVGTIGIIDFDTVSLSNLHRQVLYTENDINKAKVHVAKQNLEKLNPHTQINAYNKSLTTTNARKLIADYDIIIDGSDNFSTRYLVNDACILENKPLVYGAIQQFEGQISVFNYKGGPSYRCLFPELPDASIIPSCSEAGVLGVLPGIIGTQMASETIKIILEKGEVLSGKLVLINILNNIYQTIRFNKNQAGIDYMKLRENEFEKTDYQVLCNEKTEQKNEITFTDFIRIIANKNPFQLVDVREIYEDPKLNYPQTVQIPLGEIREQIILLNKELPTVVICQSGKRSLAAANLLKTEFQFTNVTSLKGGIQENLSEIFSL